MEKEIKKSVIINYSTIQEILVSIPQQKAPKQTALMVRLKFYKRKVIKIGLFLLREWIICGELMWRKNDRIICWQND
ncbi:hypothetical protein H8E88_18775 [candidate division KSB1 bacterium]|nr:hypothetical protein [candidate division KSB1 bacterium]